MGFVLQQILTAVTIGCHLALLTVGYSLVHNITRQFNLAHGSLLMLGAYAAFIAISVGGALGFIFPTGLLIACFAGAVTGAAFGLSKAPIFWRGYTGRTALAPLVLGTGLLIFLAEMIRLLQSSAPLFIAPPFGIAFVIRLDRTFGVPVTGNALVVWGVTAAALLSLARLYRRTRTGLYLRACADDRGMAQLSGIDAARVTATALLLAGALAGLGGFLTVLHYGVIGPYMGWVEGLKALTAAVVGGIGSLRGAVLGAFVIAAVETFWSAWFAADYRDVVVFSILVLALIFRPSGLFARPAVDTAPRVGRPTGP